MKLLLLILISLNCYSQSGRYQVEKVNKSRTEGTILITEYRIAYDSISLTVTRVVREKGKIHYLLEGEGYRGAATLYCSHSERRGTRWKRHCVLYVEIRTKYSYSFTRYQIFYDY